MLVRKQTNEAKELDQKFPSFINKQSELMWSKVKNIIFKDGEINKKLYKPYHDEKINPISQKICFWFC